jgi:DNA-binding response OmpR family regulator
MIHIAVLDDEPDVTGPLATYLGAQGLRVTALNSGAALQPLMQADPPDLVLLDLGLPGEDGLSIARQLRKHHRCGLIIVTGRGDAVDKVVGLEIGADDYVTKPFDRRELLARVRAVLRRLEPPPESTPGVVVSPMLAPSFRFAEWTLDTGARRLLGPQGEVSVTTGEYELLLVFATHPGRVLSRDFLLEQTRGRAAGPLDRTIDVQIGRLRKKLERDSNDPQLLKSVRGAGYILVSQVTAA